jgi:hypothetical protein
MSVDWTRFLASLGEFFQADASGPTMDSTDEPWTRFCELATQSRHADVLRPLVTLIDRAHVDEVSRLEAMLALIQLVAPQEWPPAMDRARERCANALRTLLHELDARREDTLASRLQAALDPAFHELVSTIAVGREMLAEPCLPQELPHVSRLCNIGLRSCLSMLRAALDANQGGGEEINDAKIALLHAHSRFVEAARALHRESGTVLFQDYSPLLSR